MIFLDKLTAHTYLACKPIQIDGKEHVYVDKMVLTSTEENANFHFDNLFNGDKRLGWYFIFSRSFHKLYLSVIPHHSFKFDIALKIVIKDFIVKSPSKLTRYFICTSTI